jgi:stalled ribosome rescue protein Dom34
MSWKARLMKRKVGLWIDHKKVVIFSMSDEGAEIKRISSEMEKHIRFSGGAQEVSEEDNRDKRFTGHLNNYYDKVISYIRSAESILIFGPGEAKSELKKRLENEKLHGNIVGMETTDKMTDNQIVAKVRQRFIK